MSASMGIDWCEYFHGLSDEQLRELAIWLAARFLKVSEFTDIVDRVYAQVSEERRGPSPTFIVRYGRSVVERYAQRKRSFTELMAALEDATMSGALPGDVAAQELSPLRAPQSASQSVEDVLRALERVRSES